jgi:phosphoesterase RecJ-like protein
MTQQTDVAGLIAAAKDIIVIQADNPDADSLGSALALEQILGEMGKNVHLYCGVDMPGYLQHLRGYDRVSSELPRSFDLSIIVDTSALSLLGKLSESGQQSHVLFWTTTTQLIMTFLLQRQRS